MSDVEDPIDMGSDAGDDLFGDDDGSMNEIDSDKERDSSPSHRASPSRRANNSDEEDEDDDLDDDRSRRYASEERREPEEESKQKVVMDMNLYRHTLPKPNDREYRSFRVPTFLRFDPTRYDRDKFNPSEWDATNALRPQPHPVIRHRIDPETGHLESNSRLHRWSDGSVTISIGNEHFEIVRKNLAPLPTGPYDDLKDAHYYAAAAHLSSNTLVTVGHITEQFQVKPNQNVEDDGIAAFKTLMAKQRAAREGPTVDAEAIKLTQIDPEQMKRAAEVAERERAKAQRKRENAQARQAGYGRYGAGAGGSGGGGTGLSINDLESSRRAGGGGSRKRGAPGGGRAKKYNPEYDSDDEPGMSRKPDTYDYDDGFLARSDEEISEDEEEEGEDLLDDDEEEEEEEVEEPRRKKRQKTVEVEEDDGDEEEEEEEEERGGKDHHVERSRGRRIVDDDEDED